MTSMTEQQELKLLLELAQKLVTGEGEDPDERVGRLISWSKEWALRAGYVPLGFVPINALEQELEAQASNDDDLEGFKTGWLRIEIHSRINSAEWQERMKGVANEMLHAIAARLLKNDRQRRRRRNRTREKGIQDVS